MEINNMSLNKNMSEMRRMTMIHSSSTKARRATGVLYTDNVLDMEKIDIGDARNKNGDILSVYLKSAGARLKYKIESKSRVVFKRRKGRKVFKDIDADWDE